MDVPIIGQDSAVQISIPVPARLQEVLKHPANLRLRRTFAPRVVKAVQDSFNHPDTRLRGEVRQNEIQLRINMSLQAIMTMYFEEKLSLTQSLDILPAVLFDAIRMGQDAEQVDKGGHGRWAVDAPAEEDLIVTDEDLAAEEDPEPQDLPDQDESPIIGVN